MLHLVPAPVHRVALRVAHGLRKLWWGTVHPQQIGCCVIGFDSTGRVMLVRHSYGSRAWTLPSGGVGRGEDPAATAVREFREETGCMLHAARLVTIIKEDLHGARHVQHVFVGRADGEPCPDGREVVALEFFAPDALPPDTARTALSRLALLGSE